MYSAIEFKQENIKMYVTKMKIDELVSISQVMYYDSTNGSNYQRPPLPSHFRKIASYFMKEKNPILPSAVIAAMNSEQYEYCDGILNIKNEIRIVDGQHRIEGLKCLRDGYCKGSKERYEELQNEFEIPVVIMVIDKFDSIVEIDAFINLNSKGKKVRTDLAQAIKVKKYQHIIEKKENLPVDDELKNKISNDVVRMINRNPDSHWEGAIIQADENGNRSKQPISIIAFIRAIKPIVDKYLKGKGNSIKKEDIEIFENEIVHIVVDAWECVISKWPECFTSSGEYDSDYNICKGIGVTTLLAVFAETDFLFGYEEYKTILENTKIKAQDWLVGGKFTGYASSQGFAQIKQYIKNEIEI